MAVISECLVGPNKQKKKKNKTLIHLRMVSLIALARSYPYHLVPNTQSNT